MSDQWFYARHDGQQGPVSFDDVRRLAADGSLRPGDLVWSQSMANWAPAGSVPGLFPATVAVPGAPPTYAPPVGHPPGQVPIGYASPMPPGQAPPGIGQDAGMRWLLPVGRSGWAIVAGYLGLFSVIPIFAPLALVIGIVAIVDIRRHPNRHGMGRAIFGVVMGLIFSAVGLALLYGAVGRRY